MKLQLSDFADLGQTDHGLLTMKIARKPQQRFSRLTQSLNELENCIIEKHYLIDLQLSRVKKIVTQLSQLEYIFSRHYLSQLFQIISKRYLTSSVIYQRSSYEHSINHHQILLVSQIRALERDQLGRHLIHFHVNI